MDHLNMLHLQIKKFCFYITKLILFIDIMTEWSYSIFSNNRSQVWSRSCIRGKNLLVICLLWISQVYLLILCVFLKEPHLLLHWHFLLNMERILYGFCMAVFLIVILINFLLLCIAFELQDLLNHRLLILKSFWKYRYKYFIILLMFLIYFIIFLLKIFLFIIILYIKFKT